MAQSGGGLSAAVPAVCPPRQRRRGVRASGRHLPCACLARTQHFRWQAPTFALRLSSLGARRRGRECAQNGVRLILRTIIILKHFLLKKAL